LTKITDTSLTMLRIVLLALLCAPASAGALSGRAPVASERRSSKGGTPGSSSRQRGRGSYYAGISAAGAAACSVTHSLVVPLDVIKTRMQTDALVANHAHAAAAAVYRDAPGRGLLKLTAFFNGVRPTGLGYFLQGATKFGGYEFFKQRAYARLREAGGDDAVRKWQLPTMLASAATAEMAATVLLAPLEVLKLRVQTNAAAASEGALRTLSHIVRHEGVGTLYAGLTPIAMRQLPYTATKLVSYEIFAKLTTGVARAIERTFMPESSGEVLRPYAIVMAGLVAGAAAAVVSHPADLLLTRVCGSATAMARERVRRVWPHASAQALLQPQHRLPHSGCPAPMRLSLSLSLSPSLVLLRAEPDPATLRPCDPATLLLRR
tara:strand:- start:34 stop:1167 length:1134 start_codon:yes stop_codon:yes gene_type:complete